jgi:AcrR family transcriptional regulator
VGTAAGVRKQTLLYYFPTKEALLEACVAETGERVARALGDALDAETSSSHKAEAVIRTLFRLAGEWPEFPQFVREASRLGPDVIERFAAIMEPLRLRALAFLANEMHEGRIRRQDPALLLFTLYTAVIGSITEAGVLRAVVGEDRSRLALNRREQEVLSFVRNALVVEGGPPAEGAAASG